MLSVSLDIQRNIQTSLMMVSQKKCILIENCEFGTFHLKDVNINYIESVLLHKNIKKLIVRIYFMKSELFNVNLQET